MSSAGQPMTWQDWQNLQRQQSMAQALLSKPAQQGLYGGIADAGNDIAGALVQRGYQDNMKKFFPSPQITNNSTSQPGLFSGLKNLFSFGGDQ